MGLLNAAILPVASRTSTRTKRHLAEYERFPLHGRVVAEARDGEFMGWLGLLAHDAPDLPGLGYRLHRRPWGQGLATEGALTFIDYSFTAIGASAVEADTMSVNHWLTGLHSCGRRRQRLSSRAPS